MENLELNQKALPDPEFWRGKRVLITGHTGFKGGWLTLWLQDMGAEVCGIALDPSTTPNLFTLAQVGQGIVDHRADIRVAQPLEAYIKAFDPEIIFHLAAQPLVRTSYVETTYTYATNIMGTVHVCEAMRALKKLRAVVIVSTDKVYRNDDRAVAFEETDALGGCDPYSASKAAAEIVVRSYANAFLNALDIGVACARAGNVIGGGDWSEDRLIPDAIKAWSVGRPIILRNPDFIRPWQHVLEPLCGYLVLAQRLFADHSFAGVWNFGPDSKEMATVADLVAEAQAIYGAGAFEIVHEENAPHESKTLLLNADKAKKLLAVKPRWTLHATIQRTINWYRAQEQGNDARMLCLRDIHDYQEDWG